MTQIKQQFIQVKTKSNFESRLKAGDIKDTSIAFIEDTNQIWAKGKYYSAVPKEGHEKQILAWKASGEAKWEDLSSIFNFNLEEVLAYGVQFDMTVADPHLTRIGNMSLHKSLPIQSELKGCIAQGGKVIYWLNESDWRFRKKPITTSVKLTVAGDVYTMVADVFGNSEYDKQWIKIDGVACQISSINSYTDTATLLVNDNLKALSLQSGTKSIELGAVLNGFDGTVRVYCPSFYIKSTVDGNIAKVWLSTVKIDDTYTYQPEILIDAYRGTLLYSLPSDGYLRTLSTNSIVSVVNTNTYCRGGGCRDDYDQYLETDPFRTDLGKPITDKTRSSMRIYSTRTGSNLLSYDQYKNIFYWLYVVEYANFNSQEAYNATLTDEGYRQGGMGDGITTMEEWDNYNGAYPLTPCGYGNTLGNRTGLVSLTIPSFNYSGTIVPPQTMQMPRWRGFDNPFGDIWTNLDGIIMDVDTYNHPNHMGYVYTCQKASKYADTLNDSYIKVGEKIQKRGYTKSFDLGNAAHIIPYVIGGDTTKYICDCHFPGASGKILCGLSVGGGAGNGAGAGLGCSVANGLTEQYASSSIGYRTVSDFVSAP